MNLGIPYSIIIGPNNFKNTKLEFGIRAQNEKIDMKLDDIKKYLGEKYD